MAAVPGFQAYLDAMTVVVQAGMTAAIQAMNVPPVAEDPLARCTRTRFRLTTLPGGKAELANPGFTKEPGLWPILMARAAITRASLKTPHGTPGEYVLAFDQAMKKFYPNISDINATRIRELFVQVGIMYVCHPAVGGPEELLENIEPLVLEATSVIVSLDSERIAQTIGPEAARVYEESRNILDPNLFGARAAEAVKSASYKASRQSGSGGVGGGTHYDNGRGRGNGGGGDGSPRTTKCRRCKELIVGPMKDHNVFGVCKKKKK